MVSSKSIYDLKSSSDGKRILISRYYPRGVKKDRFDLWIRQASPGIPLLKEYKSGAIDWKEFSKRFRTQMTKTPEGKRALAELAEQAKLSDSITLLCYEKEGENCHRNIVKSILDRKLRLYQPKRSKKRREKLRKANYISSSSR